MRWLKEWVFISVKVQMQNLWGILWMLQNSMTMWNNLITQRNSFHSSQLSHVIFWLWSTKELEKLPSLMCSLEVFLSDFYRSLQKTDSDLDVNSQTSVRSETTCAAVWPRYNPLHLSLTFMACTRGWSSFLREEGQKKCAKWLRVLFCPSWDHLSVYRAPWRALRSGSNCYLSVFLILPNLVLCLPLFSFSFPLKDPARSV